jgi:hypothetical protein
VSSFKNAVILLMEKDFMLRTPAFGRAFWWGVINQVTGIFRPLAEKLGLTSYFERVSSTARNDVSTSFKVGDGLRRNASMRCSSHSGAVITGTFRCRSNNNSWGSVATESAGLSITIVTLIVV